MTRAGKGSAKGKASKGPPAGSAGNLQKRMESARISNQIAAFEKSGGRVEKLGTTRVLRKIGPDADPQPSKAAEAPAGKGKKKAAASTPAEPAKKKAPAKRSPAAKKTAAPAAPARKR